MPAEEVTISLEERISYKTLKYSRKEKIASQLQLSRVNDNSHVLRLPAEKYTRNLKPTNWDSSDRIPWHPRRDRHDCAIDAYGV
ncbi:hypothetical protein [Nostoc sp.]|uniref:hypothetical protein n=1 Tax=Nostoc sp. TaxID=1180 RepID=UPI002FF9E13A